MSPVIIFAFNRLDSLIPTVEALRLNPEAKESDLFVFVDGPRPHKEGEIEKVQAVREFVREISGFKSVTYSFAEENKGLAPSIISGVSDVMERYGRAIVVEDDLHVSRSFLRFMNNMLNLFEGDERVFQVSGFSTRMTCRIEGDAYLNGRAQSWTWGTWKDRWDSVDWKVGDYEALLTDSAKRKAFNSHGSDLFGMLRAYMEGKVSSWYVRFCYEMHRQGKYTVCPTRSLVRNDGFNADGTHCNNYNRYKTDFEEEHEGVFNVASDLKPDTAVLKEAIKYWSIRFRIYGKLMTFLHKFRPE